MLSAQSSYLDSAKRLEAYLTTNGLPLDFRWLLTEDEIKAYPIVQVGKPQVAEEPPRAMSVAVVAGLYPQHAINRTRGEHHDHYIHIRRLFQPRRLRRRQRQLDRLLGQARPRAARPPPRPVRRGAADGLRGHHVSGVR